jgi:hypothetical protein
VSLRSSLPPFRVVCEDFFPLAAETEQELIQVQSALVEAGGMELCVELLERVERVGGEDVIDDADPIVVRERDVDVRVRDEVDRERVAGRAPDRQPNPALSGRHGYER